MFTQFDQIAILINVTNFNYLLSPSQINPTILELSLNTEDLISKLKIP